MREVPGTGYAPRAPGGTAESACAGVLHMQRFRASNLHRADRIRTCDLFVPNEARYQPALQLVVSRAHFTHFAPLGKQNLHLFFRMPQKKTNHGRKSAPTGNFFRFVRVCRPGRAAHPREATGRHAGGRPAVSQDVCAPAEVEALPFLPGRVVVQFTVVPESHFIGREVENRHFFPFPRIAVCTWL